VSYGCKLPIGHPEDCDQQPGDQGRAAAQGGQRGLGVGVERIPIDAVPHS